MRNLPSTVTILSVPFDRGATRRGAGQGPNAIFGSGLKRKLDTLGIPYRVEELAAPPEMKDEAHNPQLKHVQEVLSINELLAARVYALAETGVFPLVLGGDHSIAIGTLAGLTRHHRNLGVIWLDAHSDLNTPDTTPSGNIHGMSLAVSLGKGDTRLTSIGGAKSPIKPENVVLIGSRSLDQGERDLIRQEGITCFTMQDIDRLGMFRVMEEAIRITSAGTDGVHLSFDIDSVDPKIAPGTGTPVQGGLSYREAHLAMEMLSESGIVTSAEFVENNPLLDRGQTTSRLLVGLIASMLGESIL
ncbi:arginase [Paenibacillus glucanolyticus]|jgi:arginase|uniref:Arginase n=1 Tax=Paenibacillus glucanolyticus TaxID=59843 RepID=A0A163L8K1_9BACL|nr:MULTISPECIES: arginase [Paenibacillus]ANA81856.1 arginase [Paenibacillus glucanolyticus]AVV59411.1 arginase [Paenibacillus glucanolyticus]AWP28592.1 arginase [Paenibacillus sp. Cedars]ETT43276.1 arginase [Paenibacillus sp. FSL R5-808]KZS47898.1 arginase [Paenibacillus glucanolyticus]